MLDRTIQKAGQAMPVVKKLSAMEEIDRNSYGVVAEGTSFGLLPVIYHEGDRTLSCVAAGLMPLRTYVSGIVTQKMFADTVSKLLDIVRGCEKNHLDVGNVSLSLDHIFVEPGTKEIRCIFWPLRNNQGACEPGAFFREFPYGLVFHKHEDYSFVADYIQFFRTEAQPFSLEGFAQFLHGNVPPAVPSGSVQEDKAPEPSEDPFKRMIEEKVGVAQRNVCPRCGVVNTMDAKLCVACGTVLMEESAGTERTNSGTGVLGYAPGVNNTGSEESPYPYLIRERTNQIISVDKPSFFIGKDKNSVDFCVTDNAAVSRRHLVIYTRADRYYIADQDSTNKTYIDGREISPNQEIEIFPGARIKLANEEFVFYI